MVISYIRSNEKLLKQNADGTMEYTIKTNNAIKGKKIEIPGDFTLACEYVWEEDKKDFVEHYSEPNIKTIEAFELEPSTFRIFKIKR